MRLQRVGVTRREEGCQQWVLEAVGPAIWRLGDWGELGYWGSQFAYGLGESGY